MRRAVLLVVVGLLLTFAGRHLLRLLAPSGWERVQARYNVRARAAGRRPIAVAVRALRRQGAPTSDEERCVSCHLGMVLPQAYAEAPLAAHPRLACSISLRRAGCVVCHGGEGAALDAGRAHGALPGLIPLLGYKVKAGPKRREALQPGCVSCHRSERGAVLRYPRHIAPTIAAGRALYLARGCPSCHRLSGLPTLGEAGPPLDGLGLRRSAAAIEAALTKPPKPMPPVRLAAAELRALVLFLQAQRRRALPLVVRAPRLLEAFDAPLPAPSAAAGALWARRVGCLGCHRLGEADGGVPDLRSIAWVRSEQELTEALEKPHVRFSGTMMPAVREKALRELLLPWLLLQRAPLTGDARQIFARVCQPCHGPQRDPGWVVLSVKPPTLVRGGKLSKAAFVKIVREGKPGRAMAPWGRLFSPAFVEQIYDALPAAGAAPASPGGSR